MVTTSAIALANAKGKEESTSVAASRPDAWSDAGALRYIPGDAAVNYTLGHPIGCC